MSNASAVPTERAVDREGKSKLQMTSPKRNRGFPTNVHLGGMFVLYLILKLFCNSLKFIKSSFECFVLFFADVKNIFKLLKMVTVKKIIFTAVNFS